MKCIGAKTLAAGCSLLLVAGGVRHAAAQQSAWNGDTVPRVFVELPPSDSYDWTRHFRLGVLVGVNLKADFRLSGNFGISGNRGPGIYDDGYVHPLPGDTQDDYTSDWGYDRADQVSGGRLLMHQNTGFTPTSGGSASEDASGQIGFDLAYGGTLHDWKRTRLGWEFGFGLLPINVSDNQTLSGVISQNVYAFDLGNISLVGLPPGYRGGPNGGPSIHGTPTQLPSPDPPLTGTITGSRTLDVTLYTMRLGPSLYWDLTRRIGVSLGAGPAIGVVSGDLKYDELVTVEGGSPSPNRGQISGTDVVYGGYVNAAVTCHLVENGDVYVGVQYLPMESTTLSGAGREAHLDLGGQIYVSAGINWPF